MQDEKGGVLGNVNRNFVGFAREVSERGGLDELEVDLCICSRSLQTLANMCFEWMRLKAIQEGCRWMKEQ